MHCTQCGTKLPVDARFCPGCAHPVGGKIGVQPSSASSTIEVPQKPAETVTTPKTQGTMPLCNKSGCTHYAKEKCHYCKKVFCIEHTVRELDDVDEVNISVCVDCSEKRKNAGCLNLGCAWLIVVCISGGIMAASLAISWA